jgi:tRNA synthetases class I (M)
MMSPTIYCGRSLNFTSMSRVNLDVLDGSSRSCSTSTKTRMAPSLDRFYKTILHNNANIQCWSATPSIVGANFQNFLLDPHMGHLYSLVIADIFARYQRLIHPNRHVEFLTGTYEHGLKIQEAAQAKGLAPIVFCDQRSDEFRVGSETHTRR